jgi:hypothetical protein
MESPISFFSGLRDPRMERTKAHLLDDILFITISAVICGAETWDDIELFGKSKEPWLRTILKLPEGIPSHDTFNRVLNKGLPCRKPRKDCLRTGYKHHNIWRKSHFFAKYPKKFPHPAKFHLLPLLG